MSRVARSITALLVLLLLLALPPLGIYLFGTSWIPDSILSHQRKNQIGLYIPSKVLATDQAIYRVELLFESIPLASTYGYAIEQKHSIVVPSRLFLPSLVNPRLKTQIKHALTGQLVEVDSIHSCDATIRGFCVIGLKSNNIEGATWLNPFRLTAFADLNGASPKVVVPTNHNNEEQSAEGAPVIDPKTGAWVGSTLLSDGKSLIQEKDFIPAAKIVMTLVESPQSFEQFRAAFLGQLNEYGVKYWSSFQKQLPELIASQARDIDAPFDTVVLPLTSNPKSLVSLLPPLLINCSKKITQSGDATTCQPSDGSYKIHIERVATPLDLKDLPKTFLSKLEYQYPSLENWKKAFPAMIPKIDQLSPQSRISLGADEIVCKTFMLQNQESVEGCYRYFINHDHPMGMSLGLALYAHKTLLYVNTWVPNFLEYTGFLRIPLVFAENMFFRLPKNNVVKKK